MRFGAHTLALGQIGRQDEPATPIGVGERREVCSRWRPLLEKEMAPDRKPVGHKRPDASNRCDLQQGAAVEGSSAIDDGAKKRTLAVEKAMPEIDPILRRRHAEQQFLPPVGGGESLRDRRSITFRRGSGLATPRQQAKHLIAGTGEHADAAVAVRFQLGERQALQAAAMRGEAVGKAAIADAFPPCGPRFLLPDRHVVFGGKAIKRREAALTEMTGVGNQDRRKGHAAAAISA